MSGLVAAIVPAYNEEGTVAATVAALHEIPGVARVIVAASASSDRTVAEAEEAGAVVVMHRGNPVRGKGGAMEEALDSLDALAPGASVILFVDGDVAQSARAAEALVDPVLSGHLDLAVARLPPQQSGGFGVVKRAASSLIRAACGFAADEPLSGQRAVLRETVEACRPLAGGFGVEVAMTIDAVRLGYRVGEVAVDMTHRPTGRDLKGFAHRGRQGVDIVRAAAPRIVRLR
jgi:glycosyltransferase involved in cell wall biosynthesis